MSGDLAAGKRLPNRRAWIGKPGGREERPLGIPAVRDRHAQGSLKQVLEPIFERDFAEHSYGFRPGRGCKDALRAVQAAMETLRQWVQDNVLTLHPEKTRTLDMSEPGEGFDFLGYHFQRSKRSGAIRRWPAPKSLGKFHDKIRAHTRRCNGHSMPEIISRINASVKGWFEYFQHSNRMTYDPLDGWIRMRLRLILRKRSKRKGRGEKRDHIRWPNAYFHRLGLFSLVDAHAEKCQSPRSNC